MTASGAASSPASAGASLKARLGCWLHERWRTECALSPLLSRLTGIRWLDLCNRIERLAPGSDDDARVCEWEWTSALTVGRVFPRVSGRLASRLARLWPLPQGQPARLADVAAPRVSVVLPVCGLDRKPCFEAVMAGLLRQSLRDIEILVLEHSRRPVYGDGLAEGVVYRHFPAPSDDGSVFNKSMLFNAGARQARAPWLLLHDADIAVPARYLESALARVEAGWEAARPIRLLLYLSQAASQEFERTGVLPQRPEVWQVTQNFPGASTLIRKDIYWELGGHDERFRGWGGEDSEFLSRLRTRRMFLGGFAPAFHLWHPPAQGRVSGDGNQGLLAALLAEAPEARVRRLRSAPP
ncbi:MAG TPA: galactosyltransferase-related protein [Candidatus Brocadiia bacterium]|nr:galactosyltransferase-related protein [Candidatus Brocadiia bacterium]